MNEVADAASGVREVASVVGGTGIPSARIAPREVPREVLENLKRWAWIGNALRLTHVLLVLAGTAAALLVATFTGDLEPGSVKLFTYVATLCIGTLTAFNVAGKADSTRRAWRHVTTAILKFRADPSFTIADLIRAYEDAEIMIGDVPFNAPARSSFVMDNVSAGNTPAVAFHRIMPPGLRACTEGHPYRQAFNGDASSSKCDER